MLNYQWALTNTETRFYWNKVLVWAYSILGEPITLFKLSVAAEQIRRFVKSAKIAMDLSLEDDDVIQSSTKMVDGECGVAPINRSTPRGSMSHWRSKWIPWLGHTETKFFAQTWENHLGMDKNRSCMFRRCRGSRSWPVALCEWICLGKFDHDLNRRPHHRWLVYGELAPFMALVPNYSG